VFFEAEMNKTKYKMKVNEERSCWRVSLQAEGQDWVDYNIAKDDYMKMDNAVSFLFNNNCYMVDVVGDGLDYTVYARGSYRDISVMNDEMLLHESLKKGGRMGGADNLSSGMPGKIVKVMVKEGDEVEEGTPLLIMEAMKMENEMRAEQSCKIKTVHVTDGQGVESGALLISFEKNK